MAQDDRHAKVLRFLAYISAWTALIALVFAVGAGLNHGTLPEVCLYIAGIISVIFVALMIWSYRVRRPQRRTIIRITRPFANKKVLATIGASTTIVGAVYLFITGVAFGLTLAGFGHASRFEIIGQAIVAIVALAEGLLSLALLAFWQGSDRGFQLDNR